MSLIDVHARLSTTLLLYTLLMAIWGLWRYFRREGVNSSYWGALVILEVLVLLQGLLGVYLWVSGVGELSGYLHVLYGAFNALLLPGIFAFTRGDDAPHHVDLRGSAGIYGGYPIALGGYWITVQLNNSGEGGIRTPGASSAHTLSRRAR